MIDATQNADKIAAKAAMEAVQETAVYVKEAEVAVKKRLKQNAAINKAVKAANDAVNLANAKVRYMSKWLAAMELIWYKWCLQKIVDERIGDSCPDVYVDVLKGQVSLLNGRTTKFEGGKAIVLKEDLDLVDQIANAIGIMCSVLHEYGLDMQDLSIEGHIHAEAHKNSPADIEKQQRISDERAQAICDAIEKKDVPKRHLVAVGFGGTRPLGTPLENRRVEIYMTVPKVRRGSVLENGPDPNMDFSFLEESDLGKLFKSSDDSQLPWKIGRGIIKFAKEAKRFMVEQLGRQTLLRPL